MYMIKKKTIPVMLLTLFIVSCNTGNVDRLNDGLLIKLKQPAENGARQLKLQVLTDKVIHVSAGPGNEISSTPSLMAATGDHPAVQWTAEEKGDTVLLKTAAITARVLLSTGRITFTDAEGNPILQEAADSKTFTPVNIDGKSLYRLHQVFESPADEAFYGLGQHQTGLMNYKDQDIDLTQYNSVAAVPFLVSSRNYGILWDNYSITRFGDDRPYEQLGKLTLYNKAHKAGGLTATYASREQAEKVFLEQDENKIDYTFLPDLKKIPAAFPMDKGQVTWEGFIEPSADGIHKFFMTTSGYIKVWIDSTLVLDKWREGGTPARVCSSIPSTKENNTP